MNILPFFMGATADPDITELFSITLDTAANLDGVSTADFDLFVAKSRVNATSWVWRDKVQGLTDYLRSDATNGATAFSDYATLLSAGNAVLYRYKRAPRFIDVVEFTTSATPNTNQRISHALGIPPGLILTKPNAATSGWPVFNRNLTTSGLTEYLFLNATNGVSSGSAFGTAVPTDADFGISTGVFGTSTSVIAYLFAHDATATGVIQQVSFATDGSGSGSINHGWAEGAQLVDIKAISTTGDWERYDLTRSPSWTTDLRLRLNLPNAEDTVTRLSDSGGTLTFANLAASQTYIASLIRAPS